MKTGFKQTLRQLASAPETDAAHPMAFYLACLLLPWLWQSQLALPHWPMALWLLMLSGSALAIWRLLQIGNWISPPSFIVNDGYLGPPLFGVLWWLQGFTPESVTTYAAAIYLVLSVIWLLLAQPLGAGVFCLFSLPVLVACNQVLWGSPWSDSVSLYLLLNLVFVCFWLNSLRATRVTLPDSNQAARELPRDAWQLELEQRLLKKEQNLEQTVHDRTKALRDTNTQLNQQIALRKTISDALVKSQTRLKQAIDASRLGLIDWDIANGQFYQSAFHDFFGEREQSSEAIIQTLKNVIHPEDYPQVRDTLNGCLDGSLLDYQLQYRVKNGDGDWLWIEECGKVTEQEAGGPARRIMGTRRNIQSEMFRDEQVRLAKSVFDHTSEGVFVLDSTGHYLSVNPAYAAITGFSSDELVGQAIQTVSETPQKEEVYARVFSEVRNSGRWQGELLVKRRHGDYFPQWTQINGIFDERNQLKYYAGLVSDLTDRKEADEKLDYLLNYDDLTKLANRVQFRDQLHRALVRFKDEGVPFALVLLDVDRFKHFNDSFGHGVADHLLHEVADRLSRNVQKVDILARVGGNEFGCIVACSPTFNIDKFTRRLFGCVTNHAYELDGHEVMLSCSLGVAMVPQDARDIEVLMQNGALAVQKAKYEGGNQIQYFDEALISFSKERLEMENALRNALNRDELEVFYQPKFDLHLRRITSFEALIRWVHPEKGLISPEAFVNIAEENGLIADLGAFVLKTACRQTKIWTDQGYGSLSVSVNLSPRQLKDPTLTDVIISTLEETGIPASQLELELTESAILEDTQSASSVLSHVRAKGIKVSIDDFGTGYSSLSYLKELPADTLKIDRAFVTNVECSQEQQAIVKAIIVLGHTLNMQIVAEGVENEAQLAQLEAFDCDLIQGYHVSRPLGTQDMEALLARQVQTA